LNAELRGVYSEPGATHFRLDPEEVANGRGTFLVVYQRGMPVGCGALRLLDAETAELKRMYVAPPVRGTGLGRCLVTALEAEARAPGVRRLVLETGGLSCEVIESTRMVCVFASNAPITLTLRPANCSSIRWPLNL